MPLPGQNECHWRTMLCVLSPVDRQPMNRLPPSSVRDLRWFAALLACGLWLAQPALASEYAEVQSLQGAGQTAEALARADEYIAAHPDDPQMRFIKANLLTASQRADEAEQLLLQLTRETPELAEPWNNLAALHAAKGQLDQALQELQTALRLKPNYATALENLGDVQARLAVQAYQRAHQLDAGNTRLPVKIEALHGALQASSKPVD
jgi:tetratricopeptide (TPR) repeat protein